MPLTGSADRVGASARFRVRICAGPAEPPPGAIRRTDSAPVVMSGSVSSSIPAGPPAIRGWSTPCSNSAVHCDASLTLPLPVHSRTVTVPAKSEKAAIGRVPSSPRRPSLASCWSGRSERLAVAVVKLPAATPWKIVPPVWTEEISPIDGTAPP